MRVNQLDLPSGVILSNEKVEADQSKGNFDGLSVGIGGLGGEGVNDILMNKSRVLVGERVIGKLVKGFLGRLLFSHKENGGEGGIRTHVPIAREPLFESGTMNHSDTSPRFLTF